MPSIRRGIYCNEKKWSIISNAAALENRSVSNYLIEAALEKASRNRIGAKLRAAQLAEVQSRK